MKKLSLLSILALLFSIASTAFVPRQAEAAFNKNKLISDSVMDHKNSMSAASIDGFLNKFSRSCISKKSGFAAKKPTGYNPTNGFSYGSYVSAGSVIHAAAQAYDINPRVLIVTLEKEQSLVTGRSSTTYCNNGNHKYAAAMGYGCPDGGSSYNWSGISLYRRNGNVVTSSGPTCVNAKAKAGFSQQVIRGAWLLKFGQQRSKGNVNWAIIRGSWDNSDDPDTHYAGPMTRGTHKRCSSCSAVFYDGFQTIDSQSVFMSTGGTAALYWYTPHIHGNQLFVNRFEAWFGSTIQRYGSCIDGTNVSGADSRQSAMKYDGVLAYTRLNNTGSGCTEVHIWKPGFNKWKTNRATNLNSQNPNNKEIISADTNGDGRDEGVLVKYASGTGKVELHFWDYSFYRWGKNVLTNVGNVNDQDGRIMSADTNGDGKDEIIYVKYNNTGSGKVEFHILKQSLKSWGANIVTNIPQKIPGERQIIAGNLIGDGRDEMMMVKYSNTGSNRVEVHVLRPNFKQWRAHYVTNIGEKTGPTREIIVNNVSSQPRDEAMLIKYDNTGSGKMEVHVWKYGFKSWLSHHVTNVGQFNPSD